MLLECIFLFLDLEKNSAMITLNKLFVPWDFVLPLCSTLRVLRFGLLNICQSPWQYQSCLLIDFFKKNSVCIFYFYSWNPFCLVMSIDDVSTLLFNFIDWIFNFQKFCLVLFVSFYFLTKVFPLWFWYSLPRYWPFYPLW